MTNQDFYKFTTEALKPFGVGLDEMATRLQQVAMNANKTFPYPPYNIVKTDDNKYRIELAVAGFGKQDIEIEVKNDTLVVSGKVESDTNTNEYLYKGIANRAFKRHFTLADTVEVQSSKLINGMLEIYLENIIPENKKPRKVDIE